MKFHRLMGSRIPDSEFFGMECLARERIRSALLRFEAFPALSIDVVARNGEAEVGQMDADLMGAPRSRHRSHQTQLGNLFSVVASDR